MVVARMSTRMKWPFSGVVPDIELLSVHGASTVILSITNEPTTAPLELYMGMSWPTLASMLPRSLKVGSPAWGSPDGAGLALAEVSLAEGRVTSGVDVATSCPTLEQPVMASTSAPPTAR